MCMLHNSFFCEQRQKKNLLKSSLSDNKKSWTKIRMEPANRKGPVFGASGVTFFFRLDAFLVGSSQATSVNQPQVIYFSHANFLCSSLYKRASSGPACYCSLSQLRTTDTFLAMSFTDFSGAFCAVAITLASFVSLAKTNWADVSSAPGGFRQMMLPSLDTHFMDEGSS